MIITPDKDIEQLPAIEKVIEIVSQSTDGEMIINKPLLETPEFMRIWGNMIIIEKNSDDLTFRYFGSNISKYYGTDLQGIMVENASASDETKVIMKSFYNGVITNLAPSTVSGDLDYVVPSINKWAMIMFPLRIEGEVDSCVGWAYQLQSN